MIDTRLARDMTDDELEPFRLSARDKLRAETDTGFMARQVLGFNHDRAFKDGRFVECNVGTGGIRDHGPHRAMTDFVDRGEGRFLLMAPRASYKSSLVQARVIRAIVGNPNVRIAIGMDTKIQANEKALAIRNQLENNKILVATWGRQVGERWGQTRFTVAGRTNTGLQEPTVTVFSTDAPITGGHYEMVIPDDMVNHENVRTQESREKTKVMWQQLGPLLEPGGVELILGTHYHFDDLYSSDIKDSQDYDKLILDSGVHMVKQDGVWDIHPTPEFRNGRFPHQPISFLKRHLRRGYTYFMTQYMNQVAISSDAAFAPQSFVSMPCPQDLSKMNGWILTDTAASDSDSACYGVVAYVLLDQAGVAYVADLRAGRWNPSSFLDAFFAVLGRWQPRVGSHRGETFENIGLNMVYAPLLRMAAVQRGFSLNIIPIPRPGKAEHAKLERIKRLAPRVANGQLVVLDSVPKVFVDSEQGGEKVMWSPDGGVLPDGSRCPSGELVDEFVKLGSWPMKDVADCLADIEAVDREGERILTWVRPARQTATTRTAPRGGIGVDYFDRVGRRLA